MHGRHRAGDARDEGAESGHEAAAPATGAPRYDRQAALMIPATSDTAPIRPPIATLPASISGRTVCSSRLATAYTRSCTTIAPTAHRTKAISVLLWTIAEPI